MKEAYQIIKTIIRSEKSSRLTSGENKYVFEVRGSANKIDIKRAVQQIYNVRVTKVNTLISPRKPKMLRREWGYLPEWKKAIVQLDTGQQIDLST